MKTGKRILCFLLAVVMTRSMGLTGNSMKAEAATTASVPKYIRCGVGMKNYASTYVYMLGKDDSIKNIKVYEGNKTTKNLVVKQTSRAKMLIQKLHTVLVLRLPYTPRKKEIGKGSIVK